MQKIKTLIEILYPMEQLINKIQEQLDNGWYVEADDIQALINYIKEQCDT